ncbi:unnamed protein product, partial [Closterium sp. NIES-53]
RHIRLVMEVARTSMIHAAAPYFLLPFAIRYAAHHLNLWPHVSLPETSPTLRWTGKVGDALVFRVWGSRAFVRDTSADISARAILCVFLGFPPDAAGWQFYHPTLHRVLPSQDVTSDKLVPFYLLVFPYRSAPLPPPPLFLAPGPPSVDPLLPQGPAPSGVSQVDPLPGTMPVEVAVDSGAARDPASGGAEPAGAEPGDAESVGAGSRGSAPGGAEPSSAEPGGAEPGGAEPRGIASSRGPAGASPRLSPRLEPLSPQQLGKWFARRTRLRSGAAGDGDSDTGGTRAGGAGATSLGGAGASGPGGARTRTGGTGASGPGGIGAVGARGVAGDGAGGTRAGAARGIGVAGGTGNAGASGAAGVGAGDTGAGGACPDGTASPLLAPSPYTEQTRGLTEGLEPVSRPSSPVRAVRTGRRVPRPRPPPVPGTHHMVLRPSSVPQRVPLPSLPAPSLADIPDPASDLVRAASPTSDCPPSIGVECTLGTDVLEDMQEDFECFAATVPYLVSMLIAPKGDPDASDILTPRSFAEAITGPYSSRWQAAMDAKKASWMFTGTYVDAVPPTGANIVDGMWVFRVKRPPGSPPAFKARYIARGFNQRQGVDFFQTFSPTPKMTTLRVLLHVAVQRDYELHSLDFSTALQGSLHEEIWLRRPPGFTGSFPASTHWSLRWPVYGLRQVPHEWNDTLRMTLAALGFAPSTADPSLFLRTNTSLPPFYVIVYVEDLVFATADTKALALVKSELQKRHTCTDLGPSALQLPVLLATVHSSAYRSLALSSTFGRVRRAEWPVSTACGLPHVPDDLHST